ncbi:MAG: DUF1829 domain-containing protein [bacterium]|nr:DUF1829 domain-containing protein [bacterium]
MPTLEPQIKHLVEDYLGWLRARIKIEEVPSPNNGWVSITTPYLDKHNDFIQIYAKGDSGKIVLSDDGYTIDELERSGCPINSAKRKEILSGSLRAFGITEEDGVLTTAASPREFPMKKHLFLQGVLAIGDLFFLASPTVARVFRDDVERWMESENIRFIPTLKLTGRSGFDHIFDFAIPPSRRLPERLIKVFARPTRARAESMVFSWVDTREVRARETQALAILNDSEEQVPQSVVGALAAYEVTPIFWSGKDRYRDRLAA